MSVRALLKRFLCLLLAISLIPGWFELLESVEHLLHDGHLPHTEVHDTTAVEGHHDAPADEHGCTPISHTCGCHTSSPAILAERDTESPSAHHVAETRNPAPEVWASTRAQAPPTRPPIV